MLHEVKITSDNGYLPEVRSLYESAFPKEEQIPYDDLVSLIEQMPLDFASWERLTCTANQKKNKKNVISEVLRTTI